MNPEVIQFACGSCQHVLTVPAHLAGISGPCPVCGNTVTSPSPTMSAAPAFVPPVFGPGAPSTSGLGSLPPTSPVSPGIGAPVMPLPGAFPGPSASLGGGFLPPQAPAPSPAFPPAAQASPAAPSWQNPGLGQTILETLPQASAPAPAPVQPAMGQGGGGFLPPRRNEGQVPFAGGSGSLMGGAPGGPPGAPQQPAWGAGPAQPISPVEQQPLPSRSGGQGHSGLIPGAPTLPMMGAVGNPSQSGGTLLSRGIPSAPQATAQPENNPGLSLPVSPTAGVSRSRPLNKPKRASNVFMIGLALLFLGGFLVAAGWLFREPILNAVQTVKVMIPGLTKPAADVAKEPKLTEKSSSFKPGLPKAADAAKPGEAAPAMAAVTPAPKPAGSFDPDEASPQTQAALPSPIIATTPPENPIVRKAEPAMPAPSIAPVQGDVVEVKPAMTESLQGTTSPLEAPAPPPEVASTTEIRLDDVTEEAKPAAEALKKFLKAANIQERLQHTLAADMMRPIMERYYAANSDGPIIVDAIALVRYDPKPQVGGGAHAVFGLESKTWEFPVPVMLEMSQGKFKVDWLSFVEFKDRLLEKFLAGHQEGPARFHVGITRTHYFGDKVPNASNKDVFRISPAPPNPFASVVFLEKDSELARELRDKIPWGSQVWAIVELEWMKLGPQNWVQLAAVPQLNWYSVPTAPKALRGGSSSVADDAEVPTETQKAVPVGR